MPAPTITALPPAPSRGDAPEIFVSRADAFVAALAEFGADANTQAAYLDLLAAASAANLEEQIALLASGGFSATSTTTLAISGGTKSLTVQPGRSFVPGVTVAIAATASPTTKRMLGTVTAYNAATGSLSVEVETWTGSGSDNAWSVSLSGPRGTQGSPINWLLKAENYTAATGDYIFADVSGGAFTITLPAAPVNGAEVVIQDSRGAFRINPPTVNGGTFLVSQVATDTSVLLDVSGRYSFIFNSAASGWTVTKTAKGVL